VRTKCLNVLAYIINFKPLCTVCLPRNQLLCLPRYNSQPAVFDGGGVGTVFSFAACLSVCFSNDISKTDAARIIELDTDMFHDECRKPIYFGGQNVRSRSRGTTNSAGVDYCDLASAGLF